MNLIHLTLSGFRGQTVAVDLSRSTTISGRNGVGKTSILDAWTWLWTGKDSRGRGDFEVLDTRRTGDHLAPSEALVEATIESDGVTIVLRKCLAQVWTKKRGQARAVMTGTRTDHQIDGVPCTAREFADKLSSLVDPARFRVLTDPLEFGSRIHWSERRRILVQLAGSIDLPQGAEYAPLLGLDLDIERKKLDARRKEMRRELDQLPARVDEAKRGCNGAAPDISAAEAKVADLRKNLAKIDQDLSKATEKDPLAEMLAAREQAFREAVLSHQSRLREAQATVTRLENEARLDAVANERLDARLAQLRQDWDNVVAETNCPTCGQSLPADRVESTIAHRRAQITTQGRELAGTRRPSRVGEIEAARAVSVSLGSCPEPSQELLELRAQVSGSTESREAKREELKKQRRDIEAAIDVANTELFMIRDYAKSIVRVEELCARERVLAEEWEKTEAWIILVERYTREKCSRVEEAVNQKFHLARFRLFEQQINGGISECCDVLGQGGEDYDRDLNHAGQIQTGLDIIETLADAWGLRLPVWVDNAEAVIELPPTKLQRIRLVVADKKLTVE